MFLPSTRKADLEVAMETTLLELIPPQLQVLGPMRQPTISSSSHKETRDFPLHEGTRDRLSQAQEYYSQSESETRESLIHERVPPKPQGDTRLPASRGVGFRLSQTQKSYLQSSETRESPIHERVPQATRG
jgi:hypothetical protein